MDQRPSLPPPSESSLLRVAQSCCQATKVLNQVPDSFTLIALAIVVSHGMEATLKCHLLQKGKTLDECTKIGHDLVRAWNAAAQFDGPIQGPPPDWLHAMQWGHSRPYLFRYPPDMHGVGFPRVDEFVPWWDSVLAALYRTSDRL